MNTITRSTASNWYFIVQATGPRTITVLQDRVAYQYLKHSDVRYLARISTHKGNPVITEVKTPLNYGEAAMLHAECEQEVRRCLPEDAVGTAAVIEHAMTEQARLVHDLWDNLKWDEDMREVLKTRII